MCFYGPVIIFHLNQADREAEFKGENQSSPSCSRTLFSHLCTDRAMLEASAVNDLLFQSNMISRADFYPLGLGDEYSKTLCEQLSPKPTCTKIDNNGRQRNVQTKQTKEEKGSNSRSITLRWPGIEVIKLFHAQLS